MFQTSSAVLIIIFILSQSEGFSINKTAELISTYAKVAHWGTASTSKPETKEEVMVNVYGHIDVNIKRGQNLRKQPVTYYYSMQAPLSKVDQSKEEPIPSKGEVQERFNPRPYFDFVFDDRPRTNPQPNENKGKPPSLVYGTPVDSFPPSESKPSSDAYSSPFSSYNPPDIKPDDSKNIAVFPPNENQPPTPPSDLYETPNDDRPVLFATPSDDKPPPSGPYVTPPSDIYGPPKPATEENMKPAYDYSFPKRPDHFYLGPPPPNNNEDSDSYFAPPSPEQGQRTHPPDGPPVTQTVEPPGPPYHDHHHGPSMAEEDLAPPVPEAPYGKIPQYLDHQPNDHDLYHFGHHDVYHEVHHPTTTTTEAPRAGPYSYYYLGRKLWYIPLYFSVYFIVYVTILILKSIARHKIQFSHNFDKGRNSRELNDVNQSVMESIENAENKYM